MSGKKVNTSIKKYGKALSVSGERITRQFDIEAVHDFRSTVKKMRALLRWRSPVRSPLTTPFAKIYRLSGELRNAQIMLKDPEIEKEEMKGFRRWLTASITRREEDWYKKYKPDIIRRLRKKLDRSDYKKPNRKGLRSFCRKRVNRIGGILYLPSPSDESLHDARKMLKDMQYVYAWSIKERLTDDGPALQTIKEIGEQAGELNDRRFAIILLTEYLEQETPEEPTRQALMEIRQKWEMSKEQQKKELIETLAGFVKGTRWQ